MRGGFPPPHPLIGAPLIGELTYTYCYGGTNTTSTDDRNNLFFLLYISRCRLTVGTTMEGNFLGGTKSPKKVVHFECGNVSRKWFGASHQPCSCWFDMHDSLQTRKKSFHNFYTMTFQVQITIQVGRNSRKKSFGWV